MSTEIPMTIFIERHIFDEHFLPKIPLVNHGEFVHTIKGGFMDGMRRKYSYVESRRLRFVFFEKTDLFLWNYKSMMHKFAPNTGNPAKDTLAYMIVQCQKSEWVSIAASMEPLADLSIAAKEYVWVDFGVSHMFKGQTDIMQIELYKMRNRVNRRLLQSGESDKVLFARCWDPNHPYSGDIYKDINWSFAGSVFGGSERTINEFAKKMREKCFQILRERNTIMWEINVWLLIYFDVPELFALYPSDHSDIIFKNYN
jgi:hypothetical protein